jgi:hypothetical protein
MFQVAQKTTDPKTKKPSLLLVAGPYKDGKEAMAWIGYVVDRFGKDPKEYQIQEMDPPEHAETVAGIEV